MFEKQSHETEDRSPELAEVWFSILKDADGYPESKSWEGLFAEKRDEGYVLRNVPFYLKNVSYGDTVEAVNKEFLTFTRVLERAGHNTYRLLLPEEERPKLAAITQELRDRGLRVETEIGMLLAVDVPPDSDQELHDQFLVAGSEAGRWQLQDGCLNGFNEIADEDVVA